MSASDDEQARLEAAEELERKRKAALDEILRVLADLPTQSKAHVLDAAKAFYGLNGHG